MELDWGCRWQSRSWSGNIRVGFCSIAHSESGQRCRSSFPCATALRCSVRVLVVEDDPTLADVLRLKLEREGHTVTLTPTQQEAYHALDESVFQFALLDLRLPTHSGDMDPNLEVGFHVLAHIRDRFDATRLPVIVMT